jgi:hypothetical protein
MYCFLSFCGLSLLFFQLNCATFLGSLKDIPKDLENKEWGHFHHDFFLLVCLIRCSYYTTMANNSFIRYEEK